MTLLTDLFEEEQFLAGEYVACGTYQQVGTTLRFRFDSAGYLPLSTDGKMCTYFRVGDLEPVAIRTATFIADVQRPNAA